MDNHEDYLDALTAYARDPGPEIPSVLERYLIGVAKNGETLFQWPLLKPLIVGKMEQVIQELSQGLSSENIPTRPNVENVRFEVMHARIMDALHKFNGAPFTIQRLCELLIDPKRHYKRSDKFMRGLEKNVLVVSTVDPFGRKEVSESSSKHLVNGMDSNGSPFLPRDPQSTPLPPVPGWVTTSNLASRTGETEDITDTQGVQQDSGITSNGVAAGLVSSVYTDQGEQPMAVHAEEVIEETVVTMDTNEVAAVTTDGGEGLADEEEEEEEMGGEDTNASSSSSSSSSSSEELSISDSSDSSTPTLATNVSSSTESPHQDRPWASIVTESEVTLETNTANNTPQQDANTDSQTGPSAVNSQSKESEANTEQGQPEISTSLAWHPLTTTEPSDSSPAKSSAPSQSHSAENDPNNSFGFEVTTSATKDTNIDQAGNEASSVPEDSGGVNDPSGDSPNKISAPKTDWPKNQSSHGSAGPICPTDTSQEFVASSSDSLYTGHSVLSTGYIECDSVAGLERLVSSVDASSPITALSSSTSSSLSSSHLSSPLSSHANPISPSHGSNQSPSQSFTELPSQVSSDTTDEPSAKRSRLSEGDEAMEQGNQGPTEDISSSTNQDKLGEEGGEDSNDDSSDSATPQEAELREDTSAADTTSEAQNTDKDASGEEDEATSDSPSDGSGDDIREKVSVSSPPSQLASSSDSQGFDVLGDSGKLTKEDAPPTEGVTSASDEEKKEEPSCGEQDQPMDQE